jgi:ankyrin repeat protein
VRLAAEDPRAVALVEAIRSGAIDALEQLLREDPELARAGIVSGSGGDESVRSLLHIATDWPGHFPNGAETVAVLAAAGADPNARFVGRHTETPLHWAASSDDVTVLDALIDAGADIEADGAVIGGGTPLADAVAFGQWRAAHRLLARGARTTLWQAAALGLTQRIAEEQASAEESTHAFWCACHGGQRETAALLLERGADINWIGHDDLRPLDAAVRSGARELAEWLRSRGAISNEEDARA